jgi:hypothetical protein
MERVIHISLLLFSPSKWNSFQALKDETPGAVANGQPGEGIRVDINSCAGCYNPIA